MRLPPSMRIAPVTVAVVWAACIVCVGAYLDKDRMGEGERENLDGARRAWGANVPRQLVVSENGAPQEPIEGLTGPFDLWNTTHPQPWRILINPLHHGDLLHLLMNGWVMIYLGRILEPRMGRIRIALFLLAAAAVASLPSALAGSYSIGLSGVAYAMVGLLMVWRDRDEEVAAAFPMSLVAFCGAWLLICQILTFAEVMRIDNLAHFSGLVYGWLWGQAWLGERDSLLFRFLFSIGHLAIVPAVWFVMNPFWNGTWHWYRSYENILGRKSIAEAETDRRWRIERLQTAVLRDPSLAGAWHDLAREFQRLDQPYDAFRIALQGLRHNRTHAELRQRVIEGFVALRRERATAIVEDVCGDDSDDWLAMIHDRADPIVNRRSWTDQRLVQLFAPAAPVQPTTVTFLDEYRGSGESALPENPIVDPDDPRSALLGEIL